MKKFYKLFLLTTLFICSLSSFSRVNSFTVTVEPPLCPGDSARAYINTINTSAPTGPTYTVTWTRSAVPPVIITAGLLDTVRIPAGTYIVDISDDGDPGAPNPTSQVIFVNDPVLVTPTLSQDSVSCFGLSDGKAIARVLFGGTGPYTFNWSDPGMQTGVDFVTDTAHNLGAGQYRVTITDANGCTALDSVIVLAPTQLLPNLTKTDVSCNGASDGMVMVAPTGGSGIYTSFNWNSGLPNQASHSGLSTGFYAVTVTDSEGCTATQTISVNEPNSLSIMVATTGVDCFGDMTGTATATVTGGVIPYTYNWGSGDTLDPTVTGLAAGTYTVTVTDVNMCTETQAFTINTQPDIVIDLDSVDVDCNGNMTGVVFDTISGGTAPYNYSWFGGPSGTGPTGTSTGLTAGTYTITVTDANNCVKIDSIVVNEPPVLQVVIDAATNPTCVGGMDGTIDITITGGNPPYGQLWDDGNSSEDRTGLTAKNHMVTITDSKGCQVSIDTTLVDPTPILPNVITTPTSCRGGMDGIATAVPTGGSGIYTTYAWSSMNGTDSIETGLAAGTYMVTVTDSDGCTGTETFTITEPATLFAVTTSATDADCFGTSTGSVTATLSGGNMPYTYLWSDLGASTTPTVNGLPAATYNVTVTDANGCELTSSATVGEPTDISISLDSTDVLCNGDATGVINATFSGGTDPYSWAATGGNNGTNVLDGVPFNISSLSAQMYVITVTDANSCTKVDSILINEPTALMVTIDRQLNPLCSGDANGEIDITASGGTPLYTYAWNDPANSTTQNVASLPAGTYTVTITDNNGCAATATATLTDPIALTATIDSTRDVSCNGQADGFLRVAASGGTGTYTYVWPAPNPGTDENDNIAAGTYTVTVFDANNCQTTATGTVAEPTLLDVTAVSTDASCSGFNDGTATATPSGGTPNYTFLWSTVPPQTTAMATGLTSNTYTVTVTDANGCTDTTSVFVGEPVTIVLSTTQNNPSCNGGMDGDATVNAVGGTNPLTYLWSTTPPQTAPIANGLAAGTYTVTVTDANGCNDTISVNITEPTPVVASIIGNTPPTCNGINDGTLTAGGSGGTTPPAYTFMWSTTPVQTGATATGLGQGTYTVTVSDGNLCTDTTSFTLLAPASVVVTIDTIIDVECFGDNTGAINLSTSGGTIPYTYNWGFATTEDVSGLLANTYTLTVTDNNGCFVVESYTVNEPATGLTIDFDSTDVSCFGLTDGNVKANVTGGTTPYTFNWLNSSGGAPMGNPNDSIFMLTAGTYYITVTDSNGCTLEDSVDVLQPNAININIDNQTNVLCNGDMTGSAMVTATGGAGTFTYTWNDPAMTSNQTVNNLTAGTYTVTVTDANMCTDTLAVMITEPDTLRPDLTVYGVTCGSTNNGRAAVNVTGGAGGYMYNWGPPPIPNGQGTDSIFGLTIGNYSVTVTDANLCDSVINFTVGFSGSNYTYSDSIVNNNCNGSCEGYIEILNISGGVNPFTFNWSNGDTGPFADSLCAGPYTVTITDATGCDSIANYVITEPPALQIGFDSTDVSCNGFTDGNAKVTVSGGNMPYTYSWLNSSGNPPMGNPNDSIFNLAAGTYSITVTDGNGCTQVDSVSINQNSSINIVIDTVSNVLCAGDATGSATVIATGGTGTLTYAWNDPAMTIGATVNNLTSGTYTVTVTDGNLCTSSLAVPITEPDTLRPAVTAYDVSCGATSDGRAAVDVTGGGGGYMYNWGPPPIPNGQGTDSIFGLTAGTYTLTVTDANNCDSIISFVINSITSSFTFTDSIRNDSCGGACNGYLAILNLAGGSAPYTYNWSNGDTDFFADSLCAGPYTVTISDAIGCDSVVNFNVAEPPALMVTITTTPDTCITGQGSARATAITGGTPPYTYDWGSGATTVPFANNLSATNYLLTITDGNGCVSTEPFTIGNVAPFSINLITTNVSCFGLIDGSVQVSTTGATNPVTYDWEDGLVGANPPPVGAGDYEITVTDANGCAAIDTAKVTQPDALGVSVTTNNESCVPGMDGSATAMTMGGTTPYTFDWGVGAGPSPLPTANNLVSGFYSLTLTDANGCSVVEGYNIGVITPYSVSISTTDASCNGGADGTATANVTGATPPLSYAWSTTPTQTTSTATGLTMGNYTVTVTDGNSCSIAVLASIDEDNAIVTDVDTVQDESCTPGMDGFIKISVSGGLLPYTYDWGPTVMDGAGTDSVFNLPAGFYAATITDANGCTAVEGATIVQGSDIMVTANNTLPSCFGDADGTVSISVTGGVQPYSYLWFDNSTLSSVSNLAAGNYFVTITDAAVPPCTTVEIVTLSNPPPIGININTEIESCVPGMDGRAEATVTGGVAPLTYTFSGGTVGAMPNIVEGLAAGSYTLQVDDANGCSRVEPFTILAAQNFGLSLATQDPSCNGGSDGEILVTLLGGTNPYSYNWAGGFPSGADPKNVSAGSYTITVTDLYGCSATGTATLSEPQEIMVSFMITDESCLPGMDGGAVATAMNGQGNYTYFWPPLGTAVGNTITGLMTGTYSLTVTDDSSCSVVVPFTIGSTAPFTLTDSVVNIGCAGDSTGSITLTVSNLAGPTPETYLWSANVTGSTSASSQVNLPAGTYSVTVTDPNNGCIETETYNITEPDSLAVTDSIINAGCRPTASDGQIDITVTGGTTPYTFAWSNSATTEDLTGLMAGSYTVVITDSNSCQLTETYVVGNQSQVTADLDSVDVSCNGAMDGSATVTANGGLTPYTYQWAPSGTGTTISMLSGGTYTVTVTDDALCTAVDSIVVNEASQITTMIDTSDENCFPGMDGGAIATTAGGVPPYTYQWSAGIPSGNSVTGLSAGNYMVTITDLAGCSITDMFTINSSAAFNLSLTSTTNPVCAGDSTGAIDINVSGTLGPPAFAWPSPWPATEDLNGIPAGTYTVTVTDQGNGCTETLPVTITEPDSIKATMVMITAETCVPGMNGAISFTPTGGDGNFMFNWSGPSITNPTAQNQTNLAAGTYFLTITDGNNCTGLDSFLVNNIVSTVPNLTTVNDGCSTSGSCVGYAKAEPTGGVAPYTFSWADMSGPIGGNVDSIGALCAGNYMLTITDASNCDTILNFTILPGRTILPNTISRDESCNVDCDGMISFAPTGGEAPYTYSWAGSSVTDSVRMGLCVGTYIATITDASGCDTVVSVTIDTEQFDYTLDSTDVTCAGLNDGTATINVVGGITDFTFVWNPTPAVGDGTPNISSLTAGTYFVTITDTSNGCAKQDSIVINPKNPLLPNESFTNETCASFCDGTITLAPTGGNGNYTYNWSPNVSSGATAMNLCGGVYDVTITDQLGCDTSLTFTIQSSPLIIAPVTTQNLSCGNLGSCDGRAFVTPSNGTPPYVFTWPIGVTVSPNGPDTAINLCAGNYSVTIADAGGCQIVEPFSISGPSAITANISVTNATCNICNGMLDVTASGGTGGYTYEWFDAMAMSIGTGTNVGSLCAGAYSVRITDNSGCSETFNTNLNDIGAETITVSFSDANCFGAADGSATVSFVCMDPPCMIAWFESTMGTPLGITTNTANNLTAGDYYVEVTNNSNCLAVENVTIGEPTEIQVFATVTDNQCNNGIGGAISLSTSGGTGTYTFTWSPPPGAGQNTNSVSGLAAGTYSVTVSDDNSCDTVLTYVVNEPAAITATFTTSSANCNMSDGFINATVLGGTVAVDYDYQWFDGNNNLLIGQTNPILMNVSAGNYALRVRDDNVCEQRFNVALNNLNGPTVVVDSVIDIDCFGDNTGAVYITASGANGPFSYNWLPNGATTEDNINLTEGEYSVQVTDALGCITNAVDTVRSKTELLANIIVQDATCGVCNGTAAISVSGGTAPYSYLWSSGDISTTADSLCGGNYSVVVTDASGCTKSFDFGVNTIGGPTGETVSINPASCSNSTDGSATVSPMGGTPPYTYLWQHNGATTNSLNNLARGTYFLQYADLRGCSRTVQIDISSPSNIQIDEQIVGSTCGGADGSILLTVSGGIGPYTYSWSHTASDTNSVNGLAAGIYNVNVTDANGCVESSIYTVSNAGNPIAALPTITDASCYGLCDGSLVSNLAGSAAADFQWLDAQSNPLAAINTDLNGSVCAGTYVLEITTIPLGCKSFTPFVVNQPDSITLSSSVVRNISCAGECDGEIFINTRGGNILYSYSWSDPNQQSQIPALGLCAGVYSVTATDANGCTATTSATLTDPPVLSVSINSNTDLICSSDCNATATSSGTGGFTPYNFSWSGGQTGPDPTTLCFGMNVLTLTDARGCSVTDTVFISAIDTVVAESMGSSSVVCDGDSIHLRGNIIGGSISTFGWYTNNGATLFTTTLDTSFIQAVGIYNYVLIATSGSCADTARVNVTVVPNPVVGLNNELRLFDDEISRIDLSNDDISYTYEWTPGTELSDSTISEPITSIKEDITYVLTVTDTNGCTYVDSIQVFYSPNIEIPSGITPNGDGTNDVWNIRYLNRFPNASVQVYNRWGKLIFEANNGYVEPWDGTYKGNALPIGTYYYVIDLKDPSIRPITGPVTIVR